MDIKRWTLIKTIWIQDVYFSQDYKLSKLNSVEDDERPTYINLVYYENPKL